MENCNNRTTNELIKRYIFFTLGMIINSVGIALITKANLGTSPISSVPYVLSLAFTPSFGMFTLYMSLILFIFQLLIMRKTFPKSYLLQIPFSLVFSYFIDVSMTVFSFVDPSIYYLKVLYLLAGCVILGTGVFIEMAADVVMLPGESFVRAVSEALHKDFGKIKILNDSSMTLLACIISFVCFREIIGVREGTFVAAILVGLVARTLTHHASFVESFLCSPSTASLPSFAGAPVLMSDSHLIVTISREYGSSGRVIGKQVAEHLGISFYDRNLIKMVVEKSGLSEEYVEMKEQNLSNHLFYDISSLITADARDATPEDKLYEAEATVIRSIADKEPCVIVGRCADYILKDYAKHIHVFLYADDCVKTTEIMRRENVNKEVAEKHIAAIEKRRFNHYKYYTGRVWGLASNYDLCINTGTLGEKATAQLITDYIKTRY